MFKKEKTYEQEEGGFVSGNSANETIIGPTVKVDGDFVGEGNILVQGVVNGSLKTKGNLYVETGAKIKADIEASSAVVKGDIKGNLSIKENLELGKSSIVEGDIITKVLSMEPGAILNGHCSISTGKDDTGSGLEPSLVQKPNNQKRSG